MADTQLDLPVHYFSQPMKYDPNTGDSIPNGDPCPYCESTKINPSKDPAVLTKNQSRVDCKKCITAFNAAMFGFAAGGRLSDHFRKPTIEMGQVRRELGIAIEKPIQPHQFKPALEGEDCRICICNREIGDTVHEPLNPE